MSHGSESRPTRSGGAAFPLLLECDLRGRFMWMSDRLRSVLGEADDLVHMTADRASKRVAAPEDRLPDLLCSRILEVGGRVWITAQPPEPVASNRRRVAGELLVLQNNMQRNCVRLQTVERDLYIRAQRRLHGTGHTAIRQVERERQRLGRDLHTGVGQSLSAIHLQLEIIAMHIPDPPGPVRQALNRISTLANDALDQVRSISRRLHPPEWQRLTLETALQQLWDVSGIPQRFDASLLIEDLPREPQLETKVLVYRAAQEALSNLARHSGATQICMALELRGEWLALTIRDNGVGFDAGGFFSAPASVMAGIGLRSIREQAEALGGEFHIESGANGTKLELLAPVAEGSPG